jgi:hypothetical protein
VIEPVRKATVTSAPRLSSDSPLPAAATRVIEPIKKTRIAEGVADRVRMLILDGACPGAAAALELSSPNGSA